MKLINSVFFNYFDPLIRYPIKTIEGEFEIYLEINSKNSRYQHSFFIKDFFLHHLEQHKVIKKVIQWLAYLYHRNYRNEVNQLNDLYYACPI